LPIIGRKEEKMWESIGIKIVSGILSGVIPKWILAIGSIAHFAAIGIVKATPTLKDDNKVLPIIKFIGKWIAWDKYGPSEVNRPS